MTDEGPGEEQQPDERSGAEGRGGVEALLDRVPGAIYGIVRRDCERDGLHSARYYGAGHRSP